MSTNGRKFRCIRLDEKITEEITRLAQRDKRTFSKEVEFIVEQYLKKSCWTN